jgi:hypothetical protein
VTIESDLSVKRVIREDDSLVIVWDDGEYGTFPHSWLRANAPENRHPLTGEKLASNSDPEAPHSPWSVSIEYDETLVVSWAGLREVNRFSLNELREYLPIVESVELALVAD